MKKLYLIIIMTILLFFACNQQEKKRIIVDNETEQVEDAIVEIDSSKIPEEKSLNQEIVIERYFPSDKETSEYDTIISSLNLQISIKSKSLDSYVTNEFESDGKKYIDKYRDNEKHLRILKGDQVIVDTIFFKETFVDYTGQEFLDIANLRGYWFNEIDENEIEFFGVINKPETDWSFAYYHFFNLSTHEFRIEEYIDDEL